MIMSVFSISNIFFASGKVRSGSVKNVVVCVRFAIKEWQLMSNLPNKDIPL